MGILIVDDDDDVRNVMELLITSDGHRDVITMESAEKVFSLLAHGPEIRFDLIFLDVNMPIMDGIQLCRRIRKDARYPTVPIVMTTARDDMKTIEAAFDSGATDYLTKPLKAPDLLACVRAKLKLKAELDMRDLLQSEFSSRFQQFGTLAGNWN
jgi:sigma-B regulation protein RsbU (phosphoserine phosphatase)